MDEDELIPTCAHCWDDDIPLGEYEGEDGELLYFCHTCERFFGEAEVMWRDQADLCEGYEELDQIMEEARQGDFQRSPIPGMTSPNSNGHGGTKP